MDKQSLDDLPEDQSQDDGDVEEFIDEQVECQIQNRLWIRAIMPLLHLSAVGEKNHLLIEKIEDMKIEGIARIKRILQSDVSTEWQD